MKKKLEYDVYLEKLHYYNMIVSRIASIRMIVFFIMLVSFILRYYYYPWLFHTLFVVGLVVFIILVIVHEKFYRIHRYYERYVLVVEDYLKRESGEWKSFSDDGSDFLVDSPYYYRDLDLFGSHSLFQFLSICKTVGGRKKLKERFSNVAFSFDELKKEQDAIQEIANHLFFVMNFNVSIDQFDGKGVDLVSDFSSLKKNEHSIYLGFIVAIVGSFFSILSLVLVLFHILPVYVFYFVFLFQFMISYMYTYVYRDEFFRYEKIITDYRGVSSVFKCVLGSSFSSFKLNKMQKNMEHAVKAGNFLEKLDVFDSFRRNLLSSFLGNGFCLMNIILLSCFRYFEKRDLSSLKRGVSDIEKLEAMVSLANVGILFEKKCMPVLEEKVGICFQELIHPLLGASVCVANSFSTDSGVNIITGSNMGGKTSFLRTVGVGIILMNSGNLVCADSFSSSYFKIFTSMRVNDDLEKGISTFYGELLRIKDMVDYVNRGNMLVLIDEIFKGTNYQDRIFGAKEVIKRFNNDKTVVLLTTHDFELCEEDRVYNYHVQESYEGDKIVFDYKLRRGKCSSTNARYLMRKLGIIQK